MHSEKSTAIARAMYEALDGRGLAALGEFLDDASMLRLPGGSGLAGVYQGRDAIVGLLARMAELTDGTLRISAQQSGSSAGHTKTILGRVEGVRQGRRLDALVRIDLTIGDDRILEVSLNHPDQDHVDEFWS